MNKEVQFSDLLGCTIKVIAGVKGGDEIDIFLNDGRQFQLYHKQDCCEQVEIEDIAGDLADLIGHPLLVAEEVSSRDKTPEGVPTHEYPGSYTWTFYKLATIRGSVTIRWYGSSNGFYSESVNFCEVKARAE